MDNINVDYSFVILLFLISGYLLYQGVKAWRKDRNRIEFKKPFKEDNDDERD